MRLSERVEARLEADAAPAAPLRALASLFGAGARLRARGYDQGWLPAARAAIPVVSVGGLTVGGAGKTELAAFLAAALRARGHRPAILTRGYRRPGDAGPPDEPAMLRRRLGDAVPVIVDPDRVRGAATAAREHGASIAILDDGFQHRRLARDLDLVTLDADAPFGNGALLPAGRLREPPAALVRADLVVWLRRAPSSPAGPPPALADRPLVVAAYRPAALLAADATPVAPAESLRARRVVLISGVARPAAFAAQVAALGAELVHHEALPDHAPLDAARLRALPPADLLVCTEKDLPRLPHPAPAHLRALRVQLCLEHGRALLDAALARLPDPA